MRMVVSDSNLAAVLARFRGVPNAQLEFDLSRDGLDVVGNREGYLTLARWCLVMAHPEMEDHADSAWLHAAYHLTDYGFDAEVDSTTVLRVTHRSGRRDCELDADKVRFHRSALMGEAFWQGAR